jgi:hypothetical protein
MKILTINLCELFLIIFLLQTSIIYFFKLITEKEIYIWSLLELVDPVMIYSNSYLKILMKAIKIN